MHSLSQWFINDFITAFSRTLLHSLWQGAAAAILAGGLIAATRKAPAVIRYNGLMIVYGLFLLTVAITFFYETASPVAPVNPSFTSAGQPSAAAAITESGTTTGKAATESFSSRLLSFVNHNAVLLAGLWALLFSAQLARIAFGLRYVQTVRRKGTQPVPNEWAGRIKKAGDQLGIRQAVWLLQSERVKVPVVLGFLKPVVLVPIGLLTSLTPRQVEAILLHELAHIRRRDYLANLVQSFADAVFFFNPAVRWISARIREERETCCDDIVVQHTADKKGYVEALVSFSRLPLSPSYAMALGSNKTHLLNRVKTIITRENSRLTVKEQAMLVLGMAVMMAVGGLAFKPKEKEIKKEMAVEKKQVFAVTKKTSPANLSPALLPERSKKTVAPAVQKRIVDTPPPTVTKITEPVKWKNLSTNINDDGRGKTMEVVATTDEGTVYRIRKVDNEIIALSVNGREIAKEAYPQYYSIIDAIEQERRQRTAGSMKAQEEQRTELKRHQELLQQQEKALQNKQKALQQHLLKPDLKRQQYPADSLYRLKLQKAYEQKEQEYYRKEQNYYQKERDYNQKEQNYNQKLKLYNDQQQAYNQNKNNLNYDQKMKLYNDQQLQLYNQKKQAYHQNKNSLATNTSLSSILADLLANGLVENETQLSFTLTATEMVVNGKAVNKDLYEVFRKKYIKNNGDSYSYFKNGGTTRTTINIQ